MTKNEARIEVRAIWEQERLKGAIDSENSEFQQILNDLEKDILTPEEAVSKARAIQERRQDYH